MNWKYFKIGEFACKHCRENLIDHAFVDCLDELRHQCGFPFIITSGYRCPAHNMAVSTTGPRGPHTTGRAVDIAVYGPRAFTLVELALQTQVFRGVGLNQKGSLSGRYIHLDVLSEPNRPAIWTY